MVDQYPPLVLDMHTIVYTCDECNNMDWNPDPLMQRIRQNGCAVCWQCQGDSGLLHSGLPRALSGWTTTRPLPQNRHVTSPYIDQPSWWKEQTGHAREMFFDTLYGDDAISRLGAVGEVELLLSEPLTAQGRRVLKEHGIDVLGRPMGWFFSIQGSPFAQYVNGPNPACLLPLSRYHNRFNDQHKRLHYVLVPMLDGQMANATVPVYSEFAPWDPDPWGTTYDMAVSLTGTTIAVKQFPRPKSNPTPNDVHEWTDRLKELFGVWY